MLTDGRRDKLPIAGVGLWRMESDLGAGVWHILYQVRIHMQAWDVPAIPEQGGTVQSRSGCLTTCPIARDLRFHGGSCISSLRQGKGTDGRA